MSVVVALAMVGWILQLVIEEPSPFDRPEITQTSSPVSSPATVATPGPTHIAIPTLRTGSLPDLLRYMPDRLADGSLPLSDVAEYADIQQWMATQGIATPTAGQTSAWLRSLAPLAMPEVLATRGLDPQFQGAYGFSLADVDQLLAVGQAPDYVFALRGSFDVPAMQDAWVASGYQPVRYRNVTLWSLAPGSSVNLSAPASRPALGNLNNLVVLDDGTLLAASVLPRLQSMIDVEQGRSPSLGANPDVAALLTPDGSPQELITAMIQKGSALGTVPGTPAALMTPDARGHKPGRRGSPVAGAGPQRVLPTPTLLLAGLEHRGGERVGMVLGVTFSSIDDATEAADYMQMALATGSSPRTGKPYRDRLDVLSLRTVGRADGRGVVLLDALLMDGPDDWLALVETRDLGFVMWPQEP